MESLSDGWITRVSHYKVLMGECNNFYRAEKMKKLKFIKLSGSSESRSLMTLSSSSLQSIYMFSRFSLQFIINRQGRLSLRTVSLHWPIRSLRCEILTNENPWLCLSLPRPWPNYQEESETLSANYWRVSISGIFVTRMSSRIFFLFFSARDKEKWKATDPALPRWSLLSNETWLGQWEARKMENQPIRGQKKPVVSLFLVLHKFPGCNRKYRSNANEVGFLATHFVKCQEECRPPSRKIKQDLIFIFNISSATRHVPSLDIF